MLSQLATAVSLHFYPIHIVTIASPFKLDEDWADLMSGSHITIPAVILYLLLVEADSVHTTLYRGDAILPSLLEMPGCSHT